MDFYHAVNIDRCSRFEVVARVIETFAAIQDIAVVIDPKTNPTDYAPALTRFAQTGRRLWLRVVDSTEAKSLSRKKYREKYQRYLEVFAPITYGVEVINEGGCEIAGKLHAEKGADALEEVRKYPQLKAMACYYLDPDAPGAMMDFVKAGPKIDADINTISFYERSAGTPKDWKPLDLLTATLCALFDHTQKPVGIGEYGTEDANGEYPSTQVMAKQLLTYERFDPSVDVPQFCGFYAYWDFVQHVGLGERPLYPAFKSVNSRGRVRGKAPVSDPNRSPAP